jgi:hypothetical protein
MIELMPNLDPIYDAVTKFVEEHQGEKGYIDTQDPKNDTIYGFEYSETTRCGMECKVVGVRVREYQEDSKTEKRLEVALVYDALSYKVVYGDEDFQDENNWNDIQYSDVYYRETLLNILESIEEYI